MHEPIPAPLGWGSTRRGAQSQELLPHLFITSLGLQIPLHHPL